MSLILLCCISLSCLWKSKRHCVVKFWVCISHSACSCVIYREKSVKHLKHNICCKHKLQNTGNQHFAHTVHLLICPVWFSQVTVIYPSVLELRSLGLVQNIFQLHFPLQKVIYHYPGYLIIIINYIKIVPGNKKKCLEA